MTWPLHSAEREVRQVRSPVSGAARRERRPPKTRDVRNVRPVRNASGLERGTCGGQAQSSPVIRQWAEAGCELPHPRLLRRNPDGGDLQSLATRLKAFSSRVQDRNRIAASAAWTGRRNAVTVFGEMFIFASNRTTGLSAFRPRGSCEPAPRRPTPHT